MAQALTKPEREIILTIADDESHWTVFTDSKRAASSRLLRVAKAWGMTPERVAFGYEFTLPLKAVKFTSPKMLRPLSEAEVARRRVSAQRLKDLRGKTTQNGISTGGP